MPHLYAAMTISGPFLIAPIAHWALSYGSTSYDGLKHKAADLLRWAEKDLEAALEHAPDRRVALTVAGIDGAGKGDCYTVANFARDSEGASGPIRAWEVMPVFPMKVYPSSPTIVAGVRAMFADGVDSYDDIDPIRDGIRMMELQREEQDILHRPGGFAQLTTVTEAGITSRIIHRWPEDECAHDRAA